MMTFRLLLLLGTFTFFSQAAAAGEYFFTDPSIGAVADGKTDNRAALRKAFDTLEPGDTLVLPAGAYRIELTESPLTVPSGITLLGQGGQTRLLLATTGTEKKFRNLFKLSSDVTLAGLTIERVEAFPAVLLPMFGTLENITFRDVEIVGNADQFPGTYCHAMQVGFGTLKDLKLNRIAIRGCSFGLFQTNDATGTVEDVLVEHSTFEQNRASDLEFNSPKGKMRNIIVRDCTFRDNRCQTPGAGFAVGFANVADSKVERCDIRNYGSEALHVEDRSNNISLTGNTIVHGSSRQTNGVVMVLSDSTNVTIADNVVDARANDNKTNLILVTAGGTQFKCPSQVTVRHNLLINGPKTRTWYLQPGSGPEPEENTIVTPETKDAAPGEMN